MAKKKKRTDIVIQGKEATFNLNFQGAIQGTYMGAFKFRCYLSPLQSLAASREFRELLGQHIELATQNDRFLAFALSQLKYRIIEAPPFWNTVDGQGEVPDYDVITTVMEAASDAEVMFREAKRQERDDALNLAKKQAEKILAETATKKAEEDESIGEE